MESSCPRFAGRGDEVKIGIKQCQDGPIGGEPIAQSGHFSGGVGRESRAVFDRFGRSGEIQECEELIIPGQDLLDFARLVRIARGDQKCCHRRGGPPGPWFPVLRQQWKAAGEDTDWDIPIRNRDACSPERFRRRLTAGTGSRTSRFRCWCPGSNRNRPGPD